MKLYMKLFTLVFIGIITTFSLNVILEIRRENNFFKEQIRHDVKLLGHALTNVIPDAWQNGGIKHVKELVHAASSADSIERFRWVWFDAAIGSANAPKAEEARRLRSNGNSPLSIERVDELGEMRVFFYFPVPLPNTRPGGLEISESLSGLKQFTQNTVKFFIVMAISSMVTIGIILAVGSFWFLAKPLRLVMQRTRDIHAGHLDGSLQLRRRDEMGELALAINSMSEQLLRDREKIHQEMQARIEALEQLRHADRLRSVGRLASGVAHELGTPLNVISGRAGLIATDEAASREIIKSAETIRGQCQRMTLIIRQLLDFSRRSTPNSKPSDLNLIIVQTAGLLKPLAMKRQVKIVYSETDYPVIVIADSAQVEQVLTNLLTNAIQAMPKGGRVSVEIDKIQTRPPEKHEQKEKKYFVIRVQDEGIGISQNDLPHIFDPFFTTKDTGEGTGLGLSIAYGIVQEHGGWIEASSELGHGSIFRVYLPAEETS
jgi:two-component system, NtrC family, sensor kinase